MVKYDYEEGMTSDDKKVFRRKARLAAARGTTTTTTKSSTKKVTPVKSNVVSSVQEQHAISRLLKKLADQLDYDFHTLPEDVRKRLSVHYSQTDIRRLLNGWGKEVCFECKELALPFKLDPETFSHICVKYTDYPFPDEVTTEELLAFKPPLYYVHERCMYQEYRVKGW